MKRCEHWTKTRDMIFDSLPLMPPGKMNILVEDIWSALVAADEAYMMEVNGVAA